MHMSDSGIIRPSAEQLAALAAEKERIAALEESIRMAEQAGIDVSAEKRRLAEAKEQINRLLAVYGQSPRPTTGTRRV